MRMRGSIPDLREKQDYITKVIRTEEENFAKTIDGGMKILRRAAGRCTRPRARPSLPAADAFKLYDTYGFPVDLTEEMVRDEEGMTLDRAGFDQEMEAQRVRARKAREALGDLGWSGDGVWQGRCPPRSLIGYAQTTLTGAKVLAIVAEDDPGG